MDVEAVLASTELSVETALLFLQHNAADHFTATLRRAGSEVDMCQLAALAISFSDTDLLLHRLYDGSFPIDHSFETSFPLEYVAALAARLPAVVRGVGAREAHEARRLARVGSSGESFIPVYGPVCGRYRQLLVRRVRALRGVSASISSSGRCEGHLEAALVTMPYLMKIRDAGVVGVLEHRVLSALYRYQQSGDSRGEGLQQQEETAATAAVAEATTAAILLVDDIIED